MPMLKRLNVGDRLKASEYNTLVDAYNATQSDEIKYGEAEVKPSLYGVHPSATIVPAFSLLEISGIPGTSPQETPVVSAAAPASTAPVNLFTNGPYPSESGANTFPLFPLSHEAPFKVAVPTDFSATVGDEIGPVAGDFKAGSSGRGMICLSIGYTIGSYKWCWACLAFASGSQKFFELLEDMPLGHASRAWAKFVDWSLAETGQGYVYNWGESADGIIGSTPAGFFGTCAVVDGRDAFNQAECGQTCAAGGSIPAQTPTDATIGSTSYSYTVTTLGTITSASFAATGLPVDWAINATTGAITGPTSGGGVLGPARDLIIFVTATSPKTGGGTCDLKRRLIIKIKV